MGMAVAEYNFIVSEEIYIEKYIFLFEVVSKFAFMHLRVLFF
jgi:hypothetical protein